MPEEKRDISVISLKFLLSYTKSALFCKIWSTGCTKKNPAFIHSGFCPDTLKGSPRNFLKDRGEISDILISHHFRHLVHLVAAVLQKLHCHPHAVAGYIGIDRILCLLFKSMAYVSFTQPQRFRYLSDTNIRVCIVLHHIGYGFRHILALLPFWMAAW